MLLREILNLSESKIDLGMHSKVLQVLWKETQIGNLNALYFQETIFKILRNVLILFQEFRLRQSRILELD